jgi:hypothetical protein
VRVVSWNLFHGRAVPSAGRPLLHEFATTLAGWPWDVALLQEVPPWWPPLLARAAGADHRAVLTSRNALLPVRRAVSSRRPDLLKANGGGSDAILVRGGLRIDVHARLRLRVWPERRMVHAVRLVAPVDRPGPLDGCWVGNVHAQGPGVGGTHGAGSDRPTGPGAVRGAAGATPADVPVAFATATRWAGGRGSAVAGGPPLLLGGDFNLRPGELDAVLPAGWSRLASRDVDHLTARGLCTVDAASLPGRALADGSVLSDHPALSVRVAPAS